ncbi:MAG: flagellar protein FlaG [Thermodesulfobacteriota bacterium]
MNIDGVKNVTRTGAESVAEPRAGLDKNAAQVRVGFISDPAEAVKDAPPQSIDAIAAEVQLQIKRLNTELRFEVGDVPKENIVKIIDADTGDVIRQIPSEDLVALRDRMQELIGVLYNSRA